MFKALKELFVYFKYRRIVKQEASSDIIWTRKNLRYDWLCRIYTVVNLGPEVVMSPDIPSEARTPFVLEEIKPINMYMRKCGLEELITVSVDPIDTTDYGSFLVVYYFIFKHFNFFWFLFYFIIVPVAACFSLFWFLF
jgi:hypothetical protein